jgi:hypothetical protein
MGWIVEYFSGEEAADGYEVELWANIVDRGQAGFLVMKHLRTSWEL